MTAASPHRAAPGTPTWALPVVHLGTADDVITRWRTGEGGGRTVRGLRVLAPGGLPVLLLAAGTGAVAAALVLLLVLVLVLVLCLTVPHAAVAARQDARLEIDVIDVRAERGVS